MNAEIILTDAELAAVEAARVAGVALSVGEQVFPTQAAAAGATPSGAAPSSAGNVIRGLSPVVTALLGPAGGAADAAVADVIDVGTWIWRMFDKHTGHTSDHATLGEAQKAAAIQLQAKHGGAMTDSANQTTVDITPVIKVGVSDATKIVPAFVQMKADNLTKSD